MTTTPSLPLPLLSSLECPYKSYSLLHEIKLYIRMYILGGKYLLVGLKKLGRRYSCEALMKYGNEIESSIGYIVDAIFTTNPLPLVYSAVPKEDPDLRDPLLLLI